MPDHLLGVDRTPSSEANRVSVLDRPARERDEWAASVLDRLTPVMAALGLIFLLVVVGEQLARTGSPVSLALTVLGWALWVVFVVEFLARMVVASSTVAFLKHNWWQVLFLALPFLRVLRLVRALRFLRAARVVSSAVRSSRSAHRVLGSRLGWLTAFWAIVVLTTSQVLYVLADFDGYGEALHATALATITGEPLGRTDGLSLVLDVALAIFSVVVFATVAASLGAYFLDDRREDEPAGHP